jgi:hypothetical protein
LAVLPGGHYVASHDEFGPQSTEHTRAVTRVFQSADRGQTWSQVSQVDGQFWSTLFLHRDALYLLGTEHHHGNPIVRRSTDGGVTWTEPTDSRSGLLATNLQYHCAPVPVLEHNGRLWRALERRDPPVGWGATYCAGMLSIPIDADLLNAHNWIFSNFLPGNTNWLNGTFRGWLEGNAVLSPDGRIVNILRVDTPGFPEKAAIVNVNNDGRTLRFDPSSGFINFPGGAKKFCIRRDPQSARYWSLVTLVPSGQQNGRPASIRNTLALVSSADLRSWTEHAIILSHPDRANHGFQYVEWLFEGDDIIAACRTAYDDGLGGAHNNHDANFLTFHRLTDFRSLQADLTEGNKGNEGE